MRLTTMALLAAASPGLAACVDGPYAGDYTGGALDPAYQQPAYQQPAYQQPGYQQPGYQQPGYQQDYGYGQAPLVEYAAPPAYYGEPGDVGGPGYVEGGDRRAPGYGGGEYDQRMRQQRDGEDARRQQDQSRNQAAYQAEAQQNAVRAQQQNQAAAQAQAQQNAARVQQQNQAEHQQRRQDQPRQEPVGSY